MGASQIRRYVGTVPGTGRVVRFTADRSQGIAEEEVDGRVVRFALTDTPVIGGYFMAEPAPDNYL